MSQHPVTLSVVIIGSNSEEPALRKELEGHADIKAVEANPARGLAAARTHKVDVALLVLDHAPDAILELTRQLSAAGECIPIVVSSNKQPDNILKAMRAGARDFAYLGGEQADCVRALRELSLTRAPSAAKTGKVVTVFGCKGGSGATTLAINLAHSLVQSQNEDGTHPSVILVDFDRVLGDVLVFLDLTSRYSYHDLMTNMARLDGELLSQSLTSHAVGFKVLAESDQPTNIAELTPADLERVVMFLSQNFDFVIIDGVHDFQEPSLVALDRADVIVCTMTQDIPSLKNASRCLRLFESLRYPAGKVRIVLNRYRSGGRLTLEAISDALSHRVDATVHNDFPTLMKCVNEGKLLLTEEPSARVAKDFKALSGLVHEAPTPKKRGLFALWGKS